MSRGSSRQLVRRRNEQERGSPGARDMSAPAHFVSAGSPGPRRLIRALRHGQFDPATGLLYLSQRQSRHLAFARVAGSREPEEHSRWLAQENPRVVNEGQCPADLAPASPSRPAPFRQVKRLFVKSDDQARHEVQGLLWVMLTGRPEIPHLALKRWPGLLTEIPYPPGYGLRRDATGEGTPDSRPGSETGAGCPG